MDTTLELSDFVDSKGVKPSLIPLGNTVSQTALQPTLPIIGQMPITTQASLGTKPLQDFAAPVKTITKKDVLANPEDMSALRDMMVRSTDTSYQTAPDEKVYDDFMSHMRWMGTNEVYTAKEAIDIYGADDTTKASYGRAYQIYDKVGNIITHEGLGDKARAFTDYTAAIATSPSLWAGFIVGKAVYKLPQFAAERAIITSTEAFAKELAAKGASKAVQLSAKREVAKASVKVSTRLAVIKAAAIEAPLATIQDSMYQNIMMETGVQEDFSYMQSAVSTVLGGAGAATSLLHAKPFKGLSGLSGAEAKIEGGIKARAGRAKKLVAEDVKNAIVKANTDWMKLVEEGRSLDENRGLRDAVVNWFTDYKTDDGFISILQRNGAQLDIESAGGFAKSLTEFAMGLDEEARVGINNAFKPLGITFDQVVNVFASTVNEAGYQNQALSSASKFWESFKNITVANRKASEGVLAEVANAGEKEAMDRNTLGYIQSTWKRLIVSHPGTTVLNVKGWGFSMAGRTTAEALQAMTLYGAAGVKTLMGSPTAGLTLGRANALMQNLGYMTKMALDPFTTVEAFYKLLEKSPKRYQRMVAQQFFQGVDNRGAAAFGLNGNSWATKATDGLVEGAQRLSFVNAQDVITKSFSGIKELDKQIRLKYNIGIDELLNQRRAYDITDDMWEKAVNALQEDTFSVSYKGSKSYIGQMAEMSEKISSYPGVGMLWPFGQFVNNTLAFAVKYSPLGLIPIGSKVFKEPSMDIGTKVAQVVVGTSAIAWATFREKGKQEQGLQWYEEKDSTGATYRVDNLFPLGLYNLAGRIFHNFGKGEGMNKDLIDSLAKQLSFPAALGDVAGPKIVADLVQYITDEQQPEAERSALSDVIGYAFESITGVAAGFTRPLDPLNDFFGAIADTQYGLISNVTTDKKQAEGLDAAVQNLTRYTNSFFSLLAGEETEDGRKLFGKPKYTATQEGPVREANVGSAIFGTRYEMRKTPIDKLLGMIDKAPFKADSFTTGNAAYDDFMNRTINPILERHAVAIMSSPLFINAAMSQKIKIVNDMFTSAKQEVLAGLDAGVIGGDNEVLLNERRKLLGLSRADRISAMKELGITTPEHRLNLTQIEMIRQQIRIQNAMFKDEFGQ